MFFDNVIDVFDPSDEDVEDFIDFLVDPFDFLDPFDFES